VPDLVGVARGRLVLVNDDDLTYCALRLDPDSLTTLVDRIDDIAELLPRSLCWSVVWEMTREAELRARDFTALVTGKFAAETNIGVVQRLLAQAQTALTSYAEEPWAAERGWPLLVDALVSRLDTAPAGSDIQLAVVNALTASVLPPPILERMRGWLAGVDVPDGLTVDTDLRWRLLQALVAHGAATEADIDAELERDRTDSGRRQALRARALIPTPEAKQRAWQRAVHDDALPRADTVAIVGGFNHPAQRSLLTPYAAKYFAEIADLWARRTSEQAQPVVTGLFPSWAVDKATVDAADAWLADQSHPCDDPKWTQLCRLVSEGRADLVRALAAREVDRS
jgi:aminopeptidase N